MHRTTVFLVLGLACLVTACTTPAPTQVASAVPATSANVHPVQGTDTICHTSTVSGTRIPVKECHTVTEWNDIRNQGTDQLGVEAQRSFPSKGGN